MWFFWAVVIGAKRTEALWHPILFFTVYGAAAIQLLWVFIEMCYRFLQKEYARATKLLALFILFCASCVGALVFGFVVLMAMAD